MLYAIFTTDLRGATLYFLPVAKGLVVLILDYVLECFQPGYHSCHRTVFVQLQNKIGLFSHDVAIEVFNEGVGATTEIGEVYTITAGMCFY